MTLDPPGLTRGALLARGALATAAAGGVAVVGPWVERAVAQASQGDADIVEFALVLEELEAAYYREALRRVPDLSAEVRRVTETIAKHETEHAAALRDVLDTVGGRILELPRFEFGGAYADQRAFLRLAETLEETGVAAYNGAAPLITDRKLLETAGGIVQIEGRHAAAIRQLRGRDPAPRAFDGALSASAVRRRVRPFLR